MTDQNEQNDKKQNQPMSLKLPEDLKIELQAASRELGETEATVARMSMRHGLRVLMASLKKGQEEVAA